MRRLLGRLSCLLEMHDYRMVQPHWPHACWLTRQKCSRCGVIR